MKRLLVSVSVCAFAGVATAPMALAQLVDPNAPMSVRDRPRPEYDPPGAQVGGFVIRPAIDFAVEANNNVFASEVNEESDVVFFARPRVTFDSTWSRHSLRFGAALDSSFHQDFGSEDRTNYVLDAEGRLTVIGDSFVGARISQARTADLRTSPDSRPAATELSAIDATRFAIFGQAAFNRLRLSGEAGVEDFDGSDVAGPGGGLIEQDQRDLTMSYASGRLDYAVSPDTRLFGSVRINTRDFDLEPPAVLATRDSNGSEFLFGISTQLSRLLRGEAAIGYFSQDYKDSTIDTIEGGAVRGRVEWFLSPITTATFTASRAVEDVDLGEITPSVATRGSLRIDHEARRNVILSAGLGFSQFDYQALDREDDRLEGELGFSYLVNRNVAVTGGYAFITGESSGAAPAPSFDQNRFTVGLSLRL